YSPESLLPANLTPGTEPSGEHIDEGNHFPRQMPRRWVQRIKRSLPRRPVGQHFAEAVHPQIISASKVGQQGNADSPSGGLMYPVDVVCGKPQLDVHVDRLAGVVQRPHAWAGARAEPDCRVLLKLKGVPRATPPAQVFW